MTVYQNCLNRFALLNKMAARAKNREIFKRLILLNQYIDFEIILQEGSYIYHNCSNRSAPFNKMAARAKIEKIFKLLLLLDQKMDFEIIIQECFLCYPLLNCSNDSATLNEIAARAVNRNKLLTTSSVSCKSVDRF